LRRCFPKSFLPKRPQREKNDDGVHHREHRERLEIEIKTSKKAKTDTTTIQRPHRLLRAPLTRPAMFLLYLNLFVFLRVLCGAILFSRSVLCALRGKKEVLACGL